MEGTLKVNTWEESANWTKQHLTKEPEFWEVHTITWQKDMVKANLTLE